MSPKWFIFFAIAYFGGVFMSAVVEQAYIGTSQTAPIQGMFIFQVLQSQSFSGAVQTVLASPLDFIRNLIQMLTFDFSFFTDEWVIFRWIFLAIGGGFVVSLVLYLLRGGSA